MGLSTGGFFVVRSQIPNWLIWLVYISPFHWSVDAAANNEFSDGRYDGPYGGASGQTMGEGFMASFAYLDGVGWKWMGVGILLFYYIVIGLVAQPLLLRYVRYDVKPGAKRTPLEIDEDSLADFMGAAVSDIA